MANAREIIRHRDSVTNIAKITRTMEMVATSRYRKSNQRLHGARPYVNQLANMVGDFVDSASGDLHPLLKLNEDVNKVILLVLSSNRGLCGGYNGSLFRVAEKKIEELREVDQEVELRVSGHKGISYFRFSGQEVDTTYNHLDANVTFGEVCELADEFINLYLTQQISAVHVIYTRFVSSVRYYPLAIKLLPFRRLAKGQRTRRPMRTEEFEFSPSQAEIFAELVPQTIRAALFYCVMDAIVTEQVSRMTAMKAATDNADQMIEALSRKLNRVRQAQITSEMLDIVGGTEALK